MSAELARLPGQLSESFFRHVRFPQNLGLIAQPSAEAASVGVCGDVILVQLLIEGDRIVEIKYVPTGCAHTLACSSAMSMLALGRSLDEALELTPEEVEAALGGLPENHRHCARLAVSALGEAVSDYYRRRLRRSEPGSDRQGMAP